ncbi:MAG: hypothetical protein M0P31_18880 [Solirubrobacteraceae bacterium]|nr:hypothetical protein [Solirubrobacteraceae bacterium]
MSAWTIGPEVDRAERAILAAALDGGVWDLVVPLLAERLAPDDFADPIRRIIFRQVVELYAGGLPGALENVVDALRESGELVRAGGEATVARIARGTVSVRLGDDIATLRREGDRRRRLAELDAERERLLSPGWSVVA